MTKLFSFGLNILADVFYPKYCFGCKRSGSYLCKFCITQVPILNKWFCIVCNKQSPEGKTHLNCKQTLTPDRLICNLSYKQNLVNEMIITGKYYFIPEVFAVLAAVVAKELLLPHDNDKYFQDEVADFVITAIPLHTKRLRWRGFNQSSVAANIFSQALQIPFQNLLTRTKNTKTQKDLTANARKINIQNAFAVISDSNHKPPKKVLLIDDVSTTGQTFLEATRVLKQNGTETVWCLCLAKD